MHRDSYMHYLQNLKQTNNLIICFDVVYPIYAHSVFLDNETIKKAIENFKINTETAKVLFILEKNDCIAICIFNGFSLSFCMTDIERFKEKSKKYVFNYAEFDKWLRRKNKNGIS